MNLKTYDNSRDGNDCHIYEHWIWHPQLQVAIKLTTYSDPDAVDSSLYQKVGGGMPPPVREWFRAGDEHEEDMFYDEDDDFEEEDDGIDSFHDY